jgi:hypothetical protein
VPEIHVISSPQIKNGRKAHFKTRAKKGFYFSKLSLNLKVLVERLVLPHVSSDDQDRHWLRGCVSAPAMYVRIIASSGLRLCESSYRFYVVLDDRTGPKTKKPSQGGLFR